MLNQLLTKGRHFQSLNCQALFLQSKYIKVSVKIHLKIQKMIYSYKSEMHNVSAHTVAGSTLPLVQLNKDEEAGNYNPFEHRKVSHPTT